MVMLLRWPINGERMVILLVANLMKGEWSCYRGGKFMEGEWSCYRGGHFNGGRMVMLQKWSLYWRENGHVTEVVTLIEGEKSCQKVRGGQFKVERMVMLRWPV